MEKNKKKTSVGWSVAHPSATGIGRVSGLVFYLSVINLISLSFSQTENNLARLYNRIKT